MLIGPVGPLGPSKNIIPKVKSENWSFGFDQKTLPPKAQREKMTVTLTVGEENRIFENSL
jgi:hypothetical protein